MDVRQSSRPSLHLLLPSVVLSSFSRSLLFSPLVAEIDDVVALLRFVMLNTNYSTVTSFLLCKESTDLGTPNIATLLIQRKPTNSIMLAPSRIFLAGKSSSAQVVRQFGSGGGTRGARGHGWWVNYRAGKGGRHLQGEYSHLNIEELEQWNDAIFALGSQHVYMDIVVEPLHQEAEKAELEQHRLVMEMASEVFPRATENFVKLLESESDGFLSSTLHRVEKKVGIMGGNVWNNTGRCHESLRMPTSLTSMEQTENMVLSHVPGVVTMLSQRVNEIDSRFLLCCNHAPHLDGKAVAIGRLHEASLEQVRKWESTLITQKGHPTTLQLRIADCGVLEGEEQQTA